MKKRKALSKKLRFEVFKRDRFTCSYCGKRPPEVILEPDHILPIVEGGEDTLENLTTACFACNRGKAGVSLENVAPAIDEMQVLENVQEMLERQLAIRRSVVVANAAREAEQAAVETVRSWWMEEFGPGAEFKVPTIRQFCRRLGLEEVRDAMDAAQGLIDQKPWITPQHSEFWRYFCGVCWNKIRDRERRE